MKTIAITIVALLALSACGGEDRDPRLEKIDSEAPTATAVYSDSEVLDLMEQVCQDPTKAPPMDKRVTQHDQGYVLGLALATCE